MTISERPQFNIKSVAIIGAGPSGIASLHELSRVTRTGKSLFGLKDISEYEEKGNTAFPKLVAFERNASVGGVWSKSAFGYNNKDPDLPIIEDDKIDLTKPEQIYKKYEIDKELEEKLEFSTYEKPIQIPLNENLETITKHQWRSSAAYEGLFTNVTNRFMQFSFHEKTGDELKKLDYRYKNLRGFQYARDVGAYLEEAVETYNLEKYIRFNSNVERVQKTPTGKWEVIVSFMSEAEGKKYLNWYKEYFDAVIIGNGKTVPIVPSFKGLKQFAETNKNKVTIKLAKSVQETTFIKNAKKLLFIGSSVSSIDLIQYAFPRDLDNPSVYISRRSATAHLDWINGCTYSKGIVNKPTIEEFLPESNSIKFTDGTVESGFDVIVICCGYHMYYPFLTNVSQDSLKWYQYTFWVDDPTLALVGNTYAGFFFNRVEAQGAALAGVWTNKHKLPDRESQLKIIANKPQLSVGLINQEFINPLINLSLEGRPHPFDVDQSKSDHVAQICHAQLTIPDLFYKIRDGLVDPMNL